MEEFRMFSWITPTDISRRITVEILEEPLGKYQLRIKTGMKLAKISGKQSESYSWSNIKRNIGRNLGKLIKKDLPKKKTPEWFPGKTLWKFWEQILAEISLETPEENLRKSLRNLRKSSGINLSRNSGRNYGWISPGVYTEILFFNFTQDLSNRFSGILLYFTQIVPEVSSQDIS